MNRKLKIARRVLLSVLVILAVLIGFSYFIIPLPEFDSPTSTILENKSGGLLSARIAKDGQWRFPEIDSIPQRFEACILHFEDRSFYSHPGVDPKGIFRATRANIQAGRVVQGGSTLTMQVARMLGNGNSRTFWNKLKETFIAFHLEINLTKEEILNLYSSNAPFGGNVVGLETAAWRYYGRSPWELSWSESATLAVLPNSPSLIYPGKGQDLLRDKRDRLLRSLEAEGHIDSGELELALLEDLPQRPEPMPDFAIHLMERYLPEREGERLKCDVELERQRKVQQLLNAHVQGLSSIEVYNGAVMILDTRSQEILAYAGNTNYSRDHANAVDCASAPRNSGSILKPIIYAAMLDAGELTPTQLIPDIPTQIADYSPENYYGDYDGVVPADQALYRSLNIPFVRLLKSFGVARFQKVLRNMGLTTLTRSPDAYGLSLMLGGAEVRLDELTYLYAQMGAALDSRQDEYPLNRWAIHHTFSAMQELTRPEGREYQRSFSSHRKIAWKTGTSFGHKDAWAIGVTPDFTIGVWIGNADGEGRSGLTGVSSAAPLLFDVMDIMPQGEWFSPPLESGTLVELCEKSGHLKGKSCDESLRLELPAPDYSSVGVCRYHRTIYTTPDEKQYGRIGCAGGADLNPQSWFVLPPIQEWYYKVKHTDHRPLPKLIEGCVNDGEQMQFIYPNPEQKVYIPKDMDGKPSRVICKLAHRDSEQEVYWYIDERYLGSTFGIHEMPIYSGYGEHRLLAVDEEGEEVSLDFEVLSQN